MSLRKLAVLATPLLLVTFLSPADPAAARADEVRRSGSCSAGAVWKLKAKPDDGRLEVELEIDSNRAGQSWTWKILDNGAVVRTGTATTAGASGSFSVERRIANRAGTDKITGVARHAATGQVCRGTLTI
jgi:hypothetical protein